MNGAWQLITHSKHDLLSHIDLILWGTEPPSLSSIWIQQCFVRGAPWLGNRLHACMCLIVMSRFSFGDDWLSLSLPSSLVELWLDLRFTVQASSVTRGGRGRERGSARRDEMQKQRFPSPLPSPLCSPTLSTQMILPADGVSTAPLQWDGGGGNCSFLFTNLWSSPGRAAVRWDLSRGS